MLPRTKAACNGRGRRGAPVACRRWPPGRSGGAAGAATRRTPARGEARQLRPGRSGSADAAGSLTAHASWPPARHDLGYGLLLLGITLLVVMRIILLVVVVGSELASCGLSTCVRQEKEFVQVGGIHVLGARYFVRLVEAGMACGADPDLPFVVRVDSPGGDFPAATRMTRALLAPGTLRPVRIEVLAGGRCESMCTVLWAAASTRVAAPAARFMFHGPAMARGGSRVPGLEAKAAVMEQAVRRVDPVLADHLKARQAFVPCRPQGRVDGGGDRGLGWQLPAPRSGFALSVGWNAGPILVMFGVRAIRRSGSSSSHRQVRCRKSSPTAGSTRHSPQSKLCAPTARGGPGLGASGRPGSAGTGSWAGRARSAPCTGPRRPWCGGARRRCMAARARVLSRLVLRGIELWVRCAPARG